jgi:hypothetical protein
MRALHAFLTAVSPLVILTACGGPSQVDSVPTPGQDGSRIISMRLRTPDGREVEVKTPGPDIDAVFTSQAVLDSILIPYYVRKRDKSTVAELRMARDAVRSGLAYTPHKRYSTIIVDSIPEDSIPEDSIPPDSIPPDSVK